MRLLGLLLVLLVVGTAGTFVGYHFWYESTYFVVTDNAQVTGDLIQVGSLNAGRIVATRFEVGQPVQAGQEMAVVRIPQEVGMPMGGTMVLEEPAAGDRLASVKAPFSGMVVARLSHIGGTVSAGQPIYAVVDPNRVYIRANVEETKLARVRPGQAVDVYMDALGITLEGRVMAITPASAATFSLLPSQNASGNFVKVTQLVPIKIQVNPAARCCRSGPRRRSGSRCASRSAASRGNRRPDPLPPNPLPVRGRGGAERGTAGALMATVALPRRPTLQDRPRLPLAGAHRRRPRHLRRRPQPDDRQRRPAAHHPDLPGDRRSGPARPDDVHAGAGRLHAGHRLHRPIGSGPSAPTSARSALFTLFTALCGLAPTIDVLIVFRILQGIGGAMVMPLGMAIIFQTAPPTERGAVMGMFGLPVLVAPMTGPVLGGYLVDAVGWRPIFLLGMPVGIAAVLYGIAILRETPAQARHAIRLGRLHPRRRSGSRRAGGPLARPGRRLVRAAPDRPLADRGWRRSAAGS